MSDEAVLILAGATASGKTDLAIELAREFDAEIVGADSRQIYRGMTAGTAAPSARQLGEVPHHLVGFLEPTDRYSAAQYAQDALDAVRRIRRRGKRVIVAGGSGFYIRALTGGIALAPQYDEALRERFAREVSIHPPEFLHDWLARRDPARARHLEANDTYRVVRALEIALAPATSSRRGEPLRTLATEKLGWLLVFLDLPWSVIDARIAIRTKRIVEKGLIEEAERIGERAIAANAVGYPQALAYQRGWSTKGELCALLERATRRYARRQRTWFRGEPATLWLAPESVRTLVREKLGWSTKRN
ncbi:MAG: tRNA (adenosine(37)-N6)-dimethylallyltransferase MiaA [Candidatus Eremiobacteraeota bacterium]|nr:tRNA (adenosine(37)-N6)-dimethylallyltransferase MiaA [Candidatus Eremiobacteraeota bacterium]